jgi:uncharacterized membrane protein YedE/YeeE
MKKLNQYIGPFFGGIFFATGLSLSGMTNPKKISGFLDLFGDWDPTLVFVMGGALFVHIIMNQFILKKKKPLFAEKFHLPTRTDIDIRLFTGAVVFGVGWAISGLCPGPAITVLVTGEKYIFIFFVPMLLGILLVKLESKCRTKS